MTDRIESLPLIPLPASLTPLPGQHFELTATSRIVVDGDADVLAVAQRFAAWLRTATGFELPVGPTSGDGDVVLIDDDGGDLGIEGYELRVRPGGVRISAGTAQGVFRGVTTLRQLLPADVEATTVRRRAWTVPAVDVRDQPRFAHRGTMLDVARHFFPVDEVLRYLEVIALFKVNVLHLHLTDDQGWRLHVPRWSRLTEVGGPSDIDGGAGGWYSPEDLARIVAHAAQRFIEIVPEIDGPGHATAALRAYPHLGGVGTPPPPFHQGGISEASLRASADATYDFLGDVVDVLAAHPGRFVHLGGDEAIGTPHDDFLTFVPRAAQLVVERGRRPMVWHEAAQAALPPGTVVQYWGTTGQTEAVELAHAAVAQGAELVLSPGDRTYLDMKYDEDTRHGLSWAGYVPVSAAYDWDPATLIPGVDESSILGVESALWTETTADSAALDHMAFPRLVSIAEIGWSPAGARQWEDHRRRLAAYGRRWDALGVGYYRSPEVDWLD